jgi:RNA 3'-terminal phosphate cyclase-like protein
MEKTITLRGCAGFRQRVVFATLSGRAVRIKDIRADQAEPGLAKHEVSFLRLLEKLTTGGLFEISVTGTSVYYKPGALVGGKFSHDCGSGRSVTWFLEGVLPLMPFAMAPITLVLHGVTNSGHDQSVDLFRTVTLPLVSRFGLEEGLDFKIVARGAPPEGGGQVSLFVPTVRKLKALRLFEVAKVKRVRGIAYATRVAPHMSSRMVEGCKAVLQHLTQDVFIYTDHYKGKESGKSPGFGCALVAETVTGALLSGERSATGGGELPEDVGKEAALELMNEILRGGCVDTTNQPTVLTLMALCPEDVSKVRFGSELTEAAIETLRLLKRFFGVVFKIEQENETIVLTCVGSGFENIHKMVR